MPSFTQYFGQGGPPYAKARTLESQQDMEHWIGFHDDFNVNSLLAGGYLSVADATAVEACLTDEVGGVLSFGTDTTDNDEHYFGTQGGVCKLSAGNEFFFDCRVKTNAITAASVIIGLINPTEIAADLMADTQTDAAILDTSSPNFIGFITAGDTAPAELDVAYMSTATVGAHVVHKNTAHTWVADTYARLGIWFDGVSTIRFYINGAQIGDNLSTATAEVPADAILAPVLGLKNGGAASKLLEVDWLSCSCHYARTGTAANT